MAAYSTRSTNPDNEVQPRAYSLDKDPKPEHVARFRPSLGFTLFYLSVIVLIPLAALIIRPWSAGLTDYGGSSSAPRSGRLATVFGAAAIAAVINAAFGPIVAWTLMRYRFPGKRLVDALVDLPFALPTAVAGIALSRSMLPRAGSARP